MIWLKAFIAGFLSTLIFHQGLFALLHLAGMTPVPPYNLAPVPPLGVPSVISLSFFGGLWGIVIWFLAGRLASASYWIGHIVIGALGPTAVAMLVVFPMKGLDVTSTTWVGGLLLNGFWGLGVAIFMKMTGGGQSLQSSD
ncbi:MULTISPECIES: hypothetical protein [Marinobacter]|uniref:DUF4175 domain-containing protein n=1 Tax=Marinobacter suaedae TaxID=3057675 RepID=A0ABT8W236_9GAMM|nr:MULTISPECIES: hypothetical protein [unclassified Marinobacter]MBZ2168024.1 hypothetical protein [Marinobacter sp. F4216]MDO3722246.1 hypothetical protein [Marinobacter sp. chi1]